MRRCLGILAFLLLLPAWSAQAFQPGEGLCWFNYSIDGTARAVFDIFRDNEGRNWIGSTSGLFEFNGYQSYPARWGDYNFKAQVYSMVQGEEGDVYVGCNDGLFRLDPSSGVVVRMEECPLREIRSLLIDGNKLRIGSLSGLLCYDLANGVISDDTSRLPHKAVYSMLRSRSGRIYIGTYDGAVYVDPETGEFKPVVFRGYSSPSGNIFVNTMIEEAGGEGIYFGTESGLLLYDPVSGAVKEIPALAGNTVKSLVYTYGMLVAGTDHGLVTLSDDGTASAFRHDARLPYSLASNVVWALRADASGNLWCGTEVGVSIVDPGSPVRVYSIADLTGSGAGQQVYCMRRDSRGILWLGGSNGIIRLDGSARPRWYVPGGEYDLSHSRVRDISESRSGELRVATDGGINIYDAKTGLFVNHRISDRTHRLNANWAYGVVEDEADSTIWIAGYLGGIFREKLAAFRGEGVNHTADSVYSTSGGAIANDLIGQLVSDAAGNKWVLHFRDTALSRIDARSMEVSRVSLKGATGEEPAMICPDDSGGVWCGFYGGVVRIGPDGTVQEDAVVRFPFGTGDETVRAMAMVEGKLWVATSGAVFSIDTSTLEPTLLALPSKNYTAIYYDKSRYKAVLGAADEIVVVEPSRLLAAQTPTYIARVTVVDGDRRETIEASDEMWVPLMSDNRFVNVDISTAEFSPGRYIRFCYRLDGENTWQLLPEGSNRVSFTSLPSGTHTLEMAVAGMESSRCTLQLEVAYPWYLGKVAVAIYLLGGMGAVVLLIYLLRRKQRRKLEELERANVLATVENRLFFLANISHELKTPLSMIIGPLSKIRTGESEAETLTDVDTAYKNAIKLNSLIHQTVEMNRMELQGDGMLIYSRIDAVAFCRDIFDSYRRGTGSERHFVFSAPEAHIYVRIDAVKLESLLSNLLSNAVKYTSEGSTIALTVAPDNDFFTIDVSDDGVGIPREEQSLVFQRLYRSPRTAGDREGTGIGLYLVRKYAELLGGSVSVESEVDQGSTFRLRLPVGPGDVEEESGASQATDAQTTDRRPRVLIVDDNSSIASFIASVLSPECNCSIAYNGKAGLAVAAGFRPDVVIADEMMPEMSGMEMCRRLRSNTLMAGVQILMLTANDSPALQKESIHAGADAFMGKPFDTPVLKAKVMQLIEKRRAAGVRIPQISEEAAPMPEESASERQLARVTEVIENNLSNPDLNVDFVCRSVDIAPKGLYRLIKKYAGVPPVDFIRQMRLRKAAMLLEQKKFSVSEVMYMVGFSSSSYFSRCFSAMFGCTPGQYPPEGTERREADA